MNVRRCLATAFLFGSTLSAVWAFQNQPVVDWIRGSAIRLATPEAGHGFEDMQPLKKGIGDARIVSLGEAVSVRFGLGVLASASLVNVWPWTPTATCMRQRGPSRVPSPEVD